MKRYITQTQFRDLPPKGQQIIFAWQKKKGYVYNPLLSIGDCIELLTDISPDFHHDINLHGWSNHVLEMGEVSVGWEDAELIDSRRYVVTIFIKKRLANATFIDLI